jgi:polysaccharide deacetylase 2 family uncharacterized protein YibQ
MLIALGCKKKALTSAELRAITQELTAAAQKITGHKSEIAIRPETHPARGEPAIDHIYITLADPSKKAALERALNEVAQRHGLERSASSAGSVLRFDYTSAGRRTQAIHIVVPVAAQPTIHMRGGKGPMLAIIVDDLGYDRAPADALLALSFPLTVSVLPHLPYSSEIAEEAHRRGDQVMLHLPMASTGDVAKPEAIELIPGMNPQEVAQALAAMLETVPHAAGVNNHQGSLATTDARLMDELMPELRRRGLFFIDSRTTTESVAYDAAERAGVRAAFRRVFLDDTPTREAVLQQLELAARDAQRYGWAVAIGHPHPGTLVALEEGLPRLEARGIRLVFATNVAR